MIVGKIRFWIVGNKIINWIFYFLLSKYSKYFDFRQLKNIIYYYTYPEFVT